MHVMRADACCLAQCCLLHMYVLVHRLCMDQLIVFDVWYGQVSIDGVDHAWLIRWHSQ